MADQVSQGGITVASETTPNIYVSQGGITVASDPGDLLQISQGGITVVAHVYPDPPTNLLATPTGPTTMTVTWDNNVMDRTSLRLERSLDGVVWTDQFVLGLDQVSYDDSGLLPNTTYYYRIAAALNGVLGPYSGTVNATTLTEAGGITGLMIPLLWWWYTD